MASPINLKHLATTWVHSHEEDKGGDQVFRTLDFPFPPARGRDAISLDADGTLRRTIPGPDDRSKSLPAGSWKVNGSRLHLHQPDGTVREFSIESLDPDRLRLRAINPSGATTSHTP